MFKDAEYTPGGRRNEAALLVVCELHGVYEAVRQTVLPMLEETYGGLYNENNTVSSFPPPFPYALPGLCRLFLVALISPL